MSITPARRPSATDLTGTWFRPRTDSHERYTDAQQIIRGIVLALTGLHVVAWDMAGGCYALGATLPDGGELLIGNGDGGLPTSLDCVSAQVSGPDYDMPSEVVDTDYVGLTTWLASHDLSQPLDADTVEAAGLDSTGRDGDPRFPYRAADLTPGEVERARLARLGETPERPSDREWAENVAATLGPVVGPIAGTPRRNCLG